jgi:hypothetical protein
MPFEVPPATTNIREESRNAVIRLNQRMESDVQEFILDYEYVWGVSGQNVTEEIEGETVTRFVSNGSRYTLAEMQEKLDLMPTATAFSMLVLAGKKRDMITAAEAHLGESYLPERYLRPAFTMQPIDPQNPQIVLTGLADAWRPEE